MKAGDALQSDRSGHILALGGGHQLALGLKDGFRLFQGHPAQLRGLHAGVGAR